MNNLSKYYDYIEPLCLDLADQVLRWADKNGAPASEARYLLQTASRLKHSSISIPSQQKPLLALEDIEPVITYLGIIEKHLLHFLNGEMTGNTIIRLGGKDLWLRYNDKNAIKVIYAEDVARTVSALASHKRILELGGGVGATTRRLAPALNESTSLLFTDIKPYFLHAIKERLPELRLQTMILDINRPPENIGKFDMVYATNALHVAYDIPQTLKWIYDRLLPGGVLVLGEGSPYSRDDPWPLDMLFAFFPGWWDVPLSKSRPYPGFLTPEQWITMMSQSGFDTLDLHMLADQRRLFGGTYTARK